MATSRTAAASAVAATEEESDEREEWRKRRCVYVCNRLSVEMCVWKQQEDHRSVTF